MHVLTALLLTPRTEEAVWELLLLDRSLPTRTDVGGQVQVLLWRGQWWRLFTSVLLHASSVHLLVNGISLVALGRLLEPWVGGLRWLGWFAAGGLGASLASFAMGVPRSDGASGGLFALLGALLVLGWRHRDQLIDDDRRLYGRTMLGLAVANIVLSLLLPFVDATSHLGGLLVGVGLAWLPLGRVERRAWALLLGSFLGAGLAGWWSAG